MSSSSKRHKNQRSTQGCLFYSSKRLKETKIAIMIHYLFYLYYIVSNYVIIAFLFFIKCYAGVHLNIRDATVNKTQFSTSWTFYSSGKTAIKNTMLSMTTSSISIRLAAL